MKEQPSDWTSRQPRQHTHLLGSRISIEIAAQNGREGLGAHAVNESGEIGHLALANVAVFVFPVQMGTEYRHGATRTVNLREHSQPALAVLVQHGRFGSCNWPAGQQRVAEAEPLPVNARCKHMMVAQHRGQFGGKVGGLVASDFLEGDNIGVDLGKGRRNGGTATLPWPVPPPDIPRQDSQPGFEWTVYFLLIGHRSLPYLTLGSNVCF